MIEEWIGQLPNSAAGNLGLFAVIVAALAVLVKSADVLVEGVVELAHDFGIPKLIIGATIVSLGTTSPEAAVSVLAALKGQPGLAIGNGVGSLICDLALILGLTIVLTRVPIRERMLKRQSRIVLGAAVLFCVLAYAFPAQRIERWMGLLLVGCLGLYLYSTLRWARANCDLEEAVPTDEPVDGTEDLEIVKRPVWMSLLELIGGLAVLLAASHVLIPSIELAAERAHIPEAVIAASLVAFGTSLPELMTAISAIRKGHPDLVVGNVLGADALNILFVIGVSATAVPLALEREFTHFQGPFMLGMLVLFQGFVMTTRGHFRRWQGVVLVTLYALFILVSVLVLPRVWGTS